jgi:predicted enzyme involved in methoxymalonyl-ACP biosynthesis
MLDALAQHAHEIGITTLRRHYLATKKNAMVREHYRHLGFECVTDNPDGPAIYSLGITDYSARNTHITVLENVHEQ